MFARVQSDAEQAGIDFQRRGGFSILPGLPAAIERRLEYKNRFLCSRHVAFDERRLERGECQRRLAPSLDNLIESRTSDLLFQLAEVNWSDSEFSRIGIL